MIDYMPSYVVSPPRMIDVPSGWKGCETVLWDILRRFRVKRGVALEFGVDRGYSTAALANYFDRVTGVDTFEGDIHAGPRLDGLKEALTNLSPFPNINLTQSTYQDFIHSNPDFRADLIHIDIVHTFDDTLTCGKWAVTHAPLVLFHDTLSFPDVMRAVTQIANEGEGITFYNYPYHNGLGILVTEVGE